MRCFRQSNGHVLLELAIEETGKSLVACLQCGWVDAGSTKDVTAATDVLVFVEELTAISFEDLEWACDHVS